MNNVDIWKKVGIGVAIVLFIVGANFVSGIFLSNNISSTIGKLQTEIQYIKDGVRNATEKLSTLEQQLGAIRESVVDLQSTTGRIESNYVELRKTSDGIRANVKGLGTTLQSTGETLDSFGDLIKQFEDFISSTPTQ